MNNSIKGTTRVSNNDKKLMRDLWVASKDNPAEKNRTKRQLTQTEKATRQAMPEERAELAFKNLRKKQKTVSSRVDMHENDDPIAVECIQSSNWSDFCQRQAVVCADNKLTKQFETHCKLQRKKQKQADESFRLISHWLSLSTRSKLISEPNANSNSLSNFRFLGDVKNKRFQNFRLKTDTNRVKNSKIVTDITLARLNDHFFSHDFCKPNISHIPLYSYKFVADQTRGAYLASKDDFCDTVVDRLAQCRHNNVVMTLQCDVNSTTSTHRLALHDKKMVELTWNNGVDFVRHPQILVQCDYCRRFETANNIVPQHGKLFFHDQCLVATQQQQQKPINFTFSLFSNCKNN